MGTMTPPKGVDVEKEAGQPTGGEVGGPDELGSMERLTLVAVCAQLLLHLSRFNIADVDLWGRLTVPSIFFACGRLPVDDFFSFTAYGGPWIDHEWLAGFVFHAALAILGDAGLTLLKWGLAAAMLWMLWLVNRRLGTPPLLVLVVSMMAIPMWGIGFGATARSQNLTYVLFALLLALLEGVRSRGGWLKIALVAPLALVWVNVHGGFVVGLGVVVLYAVGSWLNRSDPRPFIGGVALFGLMSLINPYGWEYWRFILYAVSLDRPEIAEWTATDPFNLSYWTFVALSVAAVVAVVWTWLRRRTELDWVAVLVVAATMVFGWRAVKHQPLLGIAATAFLPLLIQRAWPGLFAGRRFAFELKRPSIDRLVRTWLPAGLAATAVTMLAVMLASHDRPLGVQLPYGNFNPLGNGVMPYPVHAVEFLENAPFEGNLLAPFDHGQFLLHRLYPKFRVAMDGRLEEVYPPSTYREMMRFFDSAPPDWRIAESWGADVILWPQYAVTLRADQVPRELFPVQQDGEYIVFVRRSLLVGIAPDPADRPEYSTGPVYMSDVLRPAADRERFSTYCREPIHGPRPKATEIER